MIKTETVTIDNKDFTYTYSDKGFCISRDGILYEEAYDPIGAGREYTETEIPIETVEE